MSNSTNKHGLFPNQLILIMCDEDDYIKLERKEKLIDHDEIITFDEAIKRLVANYPIEYPWDRINGMTTKEMIDTLENCLCIRTLSRLYELPDREAFIKSFTTKRGETIFSLGYLWLERSFYAS